MGEKHKVENEEDEKKWEKLIQYYRIYCIRTYKDNPKNWQAQTIVTGKHQEMQLYK